MNLDYFAGFFDGEGYIGMLKKHRKEKRYKSPEYKPRIIVGNTKRKIIEEFKKFFGGIIYKQIRKNNNKDYYFWEISNKKAYKFCLSMKEKLFLKRKQAEIIIKFYEERQNPFRYPLSSWELNRRDNLLKEIKKLNKRGKNVSI